MIWKIGFTGTAQGLTTQQSERLYELITERARKLRVTELIASHGDCEGGDEQFHDVIYRIHFGRKVQSVKIVIHPPIDEKKRAFCTRGPIEWREPDEYLRRNMSIVATSDEMFAGPKLQTEEIRSGTWATVRRARILKRRVTIVWPDATHLIERPDSTSRANRQIDLTR